MTTYKILASDISGFATDAVVRFDPESGYMTVQA